MKQTVTRKCVKRKDPATGQRSYSWEDVTTIRYDEEERLPIILEFLKGELTGEQIVEKYHICSTQTFFAWVGKYLTQNDLLFLQSKSTTDEDMANKSKDDQIRELKTKLKQAEKKAEQAELRAAAYDKMIDLAEEAFNIPIRKKSGTKQ